MYVYILKLVKNKYYIGKTNNPDFRLDSHFTNKGCQWTKKYKPIDLIDLIETSDKFYETKEYTISSGNS